MSRRTPYEQLEYQRTHPRAFTTLTQGVNPDGSLITFDGVTVKVREALNKLQQFHAQKFGGEHPTYCLKPPLFHQEDNVCQMIEFHEGELQKARNTFIREYAYHNQINERLGDGR